MVLKTKYKTDNINNGSKNVQRKPNTEFRSDMNTGTMKAVRLGYTRSKWSMVAEFLDVEVLHTRPIAVTGNACLMRCISSD